MKKRGFTMVELLAVITVLALIMVIAAPTLINSTDAAKVGAYNTKKKLIESAAITYGQDNYRAITTEKDGTPCTYDTETIGEGEDAVEFAICILKVADLVPEYITADHEDGTYKIEDPRGGEERSLDDKEITIKINKNSKKVSASMSE